MKSIALLLLTAALWTSGVSASEETPARTAGPRLKLAMVTTDKYSRTEQTVFPSDFPRIFAVYQVADAAQGTKLKAVWIADRVEGLEATGSPRASRQLSTPGSSATRWRA